MAHREVYKLTSTSSYFFTVVGSSVKIYSALSGQIVSTLCPSALDQSGSSLELETITCAILSPHNPFQLLTGSLSGLIRVWDFLDGALLQTISISQPIYHIAAHASLKDYVVVSAGRSSKKTAGEYSSLLNVSGNLTIGK